MYAPFEVNKRDNEDYNQYQQHSANSEAYVGTYTGIILDELHNQKLTGDDQTTYAEFKQLFETLDEDTKNQIDEDLRTLVAQSDQGSEDTVYMDLDGNELEIGDDDEDTVYMDIDGNKLGADDLQDRVIHYLEDQIVAFKLTNADIPDDPNYGKLELKPERPTSVGTIGLFGSQSKDRSSPEIEKSPDNEPDPRFSK